VWEVNATPWPLYSRERGMVHTVQEAALSTLYQIGSATNISTPCAHIQRYRESSPVTTGHETLMNMKRLHS
jgi:hypothetical protein